MSVMPTPKVTIGITCFNALDTIKRALDSALAQDWPEKEIIVVDDKSTDGSSAFLNDFAHSQPIIRVLEHDKNTGAAGARNTIIGNATGEFIVFFDDDDESEPKRITNQLNVILEWERKVAPAPVACYAAGRRIYPTGYIKHLPAIGSRGDVPHGPAMADYLLFYRRKSEWFYGSGPPTCAMMARTDTLKKIGGFDANLRRVEDVDFAIRLALAGGWFVGTLEELFVQYATAGEDKVPEANRDAEIAVARKHAGYLRSVGRFNYATRWPKLRYFHFTRQYHLLLMELVLIWIRNPISTTRHFLSTAPHRLMHELKMNGRNSQ